MSTEDLLSVLDSFEQRILDAYRKIDEHEPLTLEYLDDVLAYQEIFIKFRSDMYGSDYKIDTCFDFLNGHFSKVIPDLKKRLRGQRVDRLISHEE